MKIKSYFVFNPENYVVEIKLQQPLIPILALSSLIWYFLSFSAYSVVLLSSTWILLILTYLWARTMALNVHAKRKIRYGAVQVGDEIEELIQVRNTSSLPVIWAEFIDHSNIPGYSLRSVRALGGQSQIEWTARAECQRRGVYQLGPWELLVGEPLGIFLIQFTYSDPVEVLVYPQLGEMPPGILTKRGNYGGVSRLNQPKHVETIHAFGVRGYQPGDSLRRVHWLTSARRNDLFVKSFEPEAVNDAWIVLDLDQSVQIDAGLSTFQNTIEFQAMLSATIAGKLIGDKLAVGMILGGKPSKMVVPRQGQMQYWFLLREIAKIKTSLNLPLSGVLQDLSNIMGRNQMVILITPAINNDWAEKLVMLLANKSSTGFVFLLNQKSFQNQEAANNPDYENLMDYLNRNDVSGQIVNGYDIRPVSGAFGRLSRWEFKTLGTGRILVKNKPGDNLILGKSS